MLVSTTCGPWLPALVFRTHMIIKPCGRPHPISIYIAFSLVICKWCRSALPAAWQKPKSNRWTYSLCFILGQLVCAAFFLVSQMERQSPGHFNMMLLLLKRRASCSYWARFHMMSWPISSIPVVSPRFCLDLIWTELSVLIALALPMLLAVWHRYTDKVTWTVNPLSHLFHFMLRKRSICF